MQYQQLAYAHLATVLPAFLIGTYMMVQHKGTPRHKFLGRIYLILMLTTGIITLFMPAHGGARLIGHFGWIHLFSFLTLWSVPRAFIAARTGNIAAHRGSMIGLYIGGILIAGTFAFMPGRMMHRLVFGA